MALPSGYTELEYIESSGTQYIDTGFAPNQNTRVVMDCQANALDSGGTFPFGSRGSYNTNAFCVALVPGQVFYNFGVSHQFVDYGDPYERVTIDANKNVATFNGTQSVTITLPSATFTAPNNLVIASSYDGGSVYTGAYAWSGRIYFCQIYDSDVLARDFVPCVSNGGDIGLWDDVNSVFYGNSGTGAFTAGPEIKPDEPETFWTPLIISASFAPNPATSGQSTLLSVAAVDVFGAEQEETRLVNEFYSGEV